MLESGGSQNLTGMEYTLAALIRQEVLDMKENGKMGSSMDQDVSNIENLVMSM